MLVGALALLPAGPRAPQAHLTTQRAPAAPRRRPRRDLDGRRGMVAALTVLAVALAALAGYAYSRPAERDRDHPGRLRADGLLRLPAAGAPGAAYPDGVVRTGEAVFPRLSRTVQMSFDYRVVSDEKTDLTGRGGLTAVVSDGLGWSRRDPARVPTAPSAATRPRSPARCASTDCGRWCAPSSGRPAPRRPDTPVDVTPRVSIEGEVGGSPVSSVLSPSFSMRLDGTRLALGTSAHRASRWTSMARRNGGIARQGDASLSLAGVALPVYQARAIGLLGFEIAFGARPPARPADDHGRRAGPRPAPSGCAWAGRLVDVAELPASAPGGCVDLERMSDLARVADRADMPIMVVETATRARYAVVWGDILYRYTTRPVATTPHRGPVPVAARA